MYAVPVSSVLALAIVAVSLAALAVSSSGHGRSASDVVQEIITEQGVANQADIDCSAVTDDQLEALGDAVMQVMAGSGERHELMDNMMGGEGSESLRTMYISMGQRYLGCFPGAPGSFGTGTMGMMGGMMGMPFGTGRGFRGGDDAMTGNFFGPWGMMGMGGVGMLLFWIIVIVGIGLFVAWFSRQQGPSSKSKEALNILKERYAKGEIDKQEFETKKKDLSA